MINLEKLFFENMNKYFFLFFYENLIKKTLESGNLENFLKICKSDNLEIYLKI